MKKFVRKHFLTWRLLPLVMLAIGIKLALMHYGVPFFELNSYFSTLVAANVFLLGFLISGVLPDYKEAEKLPAEIGAALDAIIDECRVIHAEKQAEPARDVIEHTEVVTDVIVKWFRQGLRTRDVMTELSHYSELFAKVEPYTQANFVVRLKQEVSSIRKMILRIRNIREVPFASPAYAVAELFTTLVVISVLLVDTGNVWESTLITGSITYVLTYMIALINDLDNPFHYQDNAHLADEIAIEPLLGSVHRNIDKALGRKPKTKAKTKSRR